MSNSGTISGTIESGGLQAVLRAIAASGDRGLLTLQGEQDLVSISFQRGGMVAADAMNRPADELLAEVLANIGALSPLRFQEIVAPHRESGRMASEVLFESEAVDRSLLVQAIRRQNFLQLLPVFRWQSGNFDWTPGVDSPSHPAVIPTSIPELLVQISDELGAEAPLAPVPDLGVVFERNPDRNPRLRTLGVDGQIEDDDPGTLWVSPDERRLLSAVNGRQDGATLQQETGLDQYAVRYGLSHLARLGLIRVASESSGSFPNPLLRAPSSAHPSRPPGVRGDAGSVRGDAGSVRGDAGSVRGDAGSVREDARSVREDARSGGLVLDEGLLDALGFDTGDGRLRGGGGVTDSLADFTMTAATPTPSASLDLAAVRRRRESLVEAARMWLARGLALCLVGLVASTVLVPSRGSSLLFSLPWLGPQRLAFERVRQEAAYRELGQAMRTYHLIFGRFPEEMRLLVDLDLVAPSDLRGPHGRWLAYTQEPQSYRLEPVEGGRSIGEPGFSGGIENDFLLDPGYVTPAETQGARAIRLLD